MRLQAPRPGPPWAAVMIAALVAGVALVLGVGQTVGLAVAGALGTQHVLVRRQRTVQRRKDQQVPDLVDLFRVAMAAGQPVPVALRTVAQRSPSALRPDVEAAVRALDRGTGVLDSLRWLQRRLGPSVEPLCDVLAAAHQSGMPAGAALDRVAAVARDRRRREAESNARRLPVAMLFPLVLCVLPAFGLLAVVPLLAAALADLSL